MSTYRSKGKASINDVYAERVMYAERTPSGVIAAPKMERWAEEEALRAKRKGEPANIVLPRTRAWAESLPRHIQVAALLRIYPRITNMLAASWSDPVVIIRYLDELVVDRRGNRQGFPADVKAELLALRELFAYQADARVENELPWQGVDKRK